MIFSRGSIRQRIWLVTSCVLIVMSLFVYWSVNLYGQRAARISYDHQLLGAALQMAESITLVNGKPSIDLPLSAFEMLAMSPDDRGFYAIRDAKNTLLTGYNDLPQPIIGSQPSPYYFNAIYSGERVRFVQLKKRLLDTDVDTSISIILGQTSITRNKMAKEMSIFVTQFVFLFLGISTVLIMLGVWLVLRPLKWLKLELESRSPSNLSPISMTAPKEITPLLDSMNYFMDRLDNTLNRLKRFTAEAAHQLRTPLAGLRLEAQSALEEPDATLREQQLKNVIHCTDELSITISQLLDQANLTHSLQSKSKITIDLPKLVTDICRDVAVIALKQNIDVAYVTEGSRATLIGNEYALKQMVRNLLENAVKYSPQHETVEAAIYPTENKVILEISDRGEGIPDSEKNRVFEYFYRAKNNIKPGTGIGLAIAKEVAEHHGATLTLKDNKPSGLIVQVCFVREEVYEA